jgi:hypothetical protein
MADSNLHGDVHPVQDTFLEVISEGWYEGGKQYVRVRCCCGKEFPVRVNSLRTGNTKSCGCKRRQKLIDRNRTHGFAQRSGRHPLYRAWANMVSRCSDPNHPKYADYGGRGIMVCPRWRDSFADFLADVGERPFRGAEIDRRDNNLGYEPGNTRWATRAEQTRNTRVNRNITHDGRTMTLTEWARELGWSFMGLKDRLQRLPLDQAMIQKKEIKR